MLLLELTSVQSVDVTLDVVNDADDATVGITGVPLWAADRSGLTVTAAGGGMSATITASQTLGDYKVKVSALAAVGTGGVDEVVIGEFGVRVIAAQGRRMQFSPGIPYPTP